MLLIPRRGIFPGPLKFSPLTASSHIAKGKQVISVTGRHLLQTRPYLISRPPHSILTSHFLKRGKRVQGPTAHIRAHSSLCWRSGELEHRITAGNKGVRVVLLLAQQRRKHDQVTLIPRTGCLSSVTHNIRYAGRIQALQITTTQYLVITY